MKHRLWTGLWISAFVSCSCLWAQAPAGVPQKAVDEVGGGNALYDEGSYDEAVKKYESAMTLAPEWYEPRYELGQTYYKMKRPEEAKKEFGMALELDPSCWLCYQGLGNLADDLGDRELALADYQKAVSLGPEAAQPRYNLAITYVRLQRTDDAISSLKEAEKLQPGYASPYFLLGNIYQRQHKLYLASDQLTLATKIEKSGSRFDAAKKLIDVQVVLDPKLDAKSMSQHMSYCLARAGAMAPEGYRKRFPGAETYVDDLAEEEYVLGTFAAIIDELSHGKKEDPEFGGLVKTKKAGYLAPYILSSTGGRFAKDLDEYERKNPGRVAEFKKWASDNKVSLEPIHPRCEVQWMGQTW